MAYGTAHWPAMALRCAHMHLANCMPVSFLTSPRVHAHVMQHNGSPLREHLTQTAIYCALTRLHMHRVMKSVLPGYMGTGSDMQGAGSGHADEG